jgi:hypothetical protein
VDVWVAYCFFSKKLTWINSDATIHTPKSTYLFGCVKETHDNLWASNRETMAEPDAQFVDINTFYEKNSEGKLVKNDNIETRVAKVYYDKTDIGKQLPGQSYNGYSYSTNTSAYMPNTSGINDKQLMAFYQNFKTN